MNTITSSVSATYGRYVFTGGPCVGKSTLIQILEDRGFPVVREVATEILVEGDPSLMPWNNRYNFQHEALKRQLRAEAAVRSEGKPVFLDRGVLDGIAYDKVLGVPLPNFLSSLRGPGYDVVFVFDELPIWEDNGVRYEDSGFTRILNPAMEQVYERNGNRIVRVPFATPAQRVDFVLDTIGWKAEEPRVELAAVA